MTEKKRIELINCAEKLKKYCTSRDRCYLVKHPEDSCLFWNKKTNTCILNDNPSQYSLGKLVQSDNRLITGDEFRERCKGGLD